MQQLLVVVSGNNRLIPGTPVLTIMHLIFQVKSTVFALKLQSLQLLKSKQSFYPSDISVRQRHAVK